jgi:hypothetical protein
MFRQWYGERGASAVTSLPGKHHDVKDVIDQVSLRGAVVLERVERNNSSGNTCQTIIADPAAPIGTCRLYFSKNRLAS